MNRELVQWQIIDPSNNLVFPWFTHPFLEVLKTWDLKDKKVCEYGGGRSTAWLRNKCELVITIETKKEFRDAIRSECSDRRMGNGTVILAEVNEGDREKEREYVEAPIQWIGNYVYDIVIVDGIFRYECICYALDILLREGGKLIVDNWQQDGFVCPACADLLKPYEGHVYRQEDHTDHHGNPWQTAYWEIPAI